MRLLKTSAARALLALLLFTGSCKSTESINSYAKSAATGIAEIGRSTPDFSQICRLYDPVSLEKFRDTSLYATPVRHVVHCAEYKTADSLTGIINQTLVSYFAMLQAVSDKKLLAYNARDLINSLAAIQPVALPSLTLSDEKISAIRGLLNSILTEPLKWYRYNKIMKTLRQNDSAVHRVLSAYSFILDSALSGEINQGKANYTSFVYSPLYQWAKTPVEKAMINQQYTAFQFSIDQEQEKIHKAVSMIGLIEKDHYLLAYGRPPAGFAFAEGQISQDIILINKLILEIIQILK